MANNRRILAGWIVKLGLAIALCVCLLGSTIAPVSAREIEARATIAQTTVPKACNYLAASGNTIDSLWSILANNGDGTVAADWAKNNTDCYAWNAFVALNWPSIGQTNSGNSDADPDGTKTIGDPGFVVWQRWKNTGDVFLANGATPAGWDPYIGPPQAVINTAQASGLCEGDCNNNSFQDIPHKPRLT